MITKPVKVSCSRDDEIIIGIQMENNHRQFVFDCSVFDEEVSSVMLVHQRSKDEAPYIAATSSTDTLVWTVTNTDTTYAGYGKAELRVSFTNGLAKSETYITRVLESITGDTVIPDPLQSWYDALIEYIDEHAASPEQIEAAVEAYLEEHPIPAPVTSVNGKLGDVVLTATDVGAVASETDPVFVASPAYGITAADIAGWNAKSDFSGSYNDLTDKPTIPTTVSELENDAGYITSAPVDSVNGKTGAVVLSASDVGAYTKPTTGIPKNDLASDVQTSLNKADTALQTAPVTSVNTKTGAVTLNAADVGAMPASYVAPVISVNGQTGNVTLDADDVGALPDSYTAPVASVDGKTGTVTILPTGGTTGQVLAKASGSNYDVEWVNQSGGGGAVDSVNGQTGTVVLDASDVGALPDNTTINDVYWCTYGTTTSAQIETALTAGKIPMVKYGDYVYTFRYKSSTTNHRFVCNYGGKEKSIACQSGTWIPNGDLTFLTTSYTPPVTSVNGQTGAVSLSIPTKTSDLTNDSGYITNAPVQSVDGKTGAVAVLPTGGASGQVLAKSSASDYAVEWVNQSGGGGGSDWQVLHDSTTTEEALLQIAITGISIKEAKIFAIEPAGYTSTAVIYCPMNNNEGNHYDKSYGRPMISLSNAGGSTKVNFASQNPIEIDGIAEQPAYSANAGSQPNIQIKIETPSRATAGMTITSMSVATYVAIPAGIRIVAFGR